MGLFDFLSDVVSAFDKSEHISFECNNAWVDYWRYGEKIDSKDLNVNIHLEYLHDEEYRIHTAKAIREKFVDDIQSEHDYLLFISESDFEIFEGLDSLYIISSFNVDSNTTAKAVFDFVMKRNDTKMDEDDIRRFWHIYPANDNYQDNNNFNPFGRAWTDVKITQLPKHLSFYEDDDE